MIYTTKPEGMSEDEWLGMLNAQKDSGLLGAGMKQKEAAMRMTQAQQLRSMGQPEGRHWTRQVTRGINTAMPGLLQRKALGLEGEANTAQQGFLGKLTDLYTSRLRGNQDFSAPQGGFPNAPQEAGQPLVGPTGIPLEGAGSIAPPPLVPDAPLQAPGGAPFAEPGMAAGGANPVAKMGANLLSTALRKKPEQQKPRLNLPDVEVTKYDEQGNPIGA